MKYQFRPYATMKPIEVTLTGKIYEVGEHPFYEKYKIIEVVDDEGGTIDAFEDEITSDEVKEQEIGYSEEDMINAAKYGYNFHKTTSFPEQDFEDSCIRNTQQWLTTFKKEIK